MIVRATTRIYETEVSMNHAIGALKRFGWKIRKHGKIEGVYEVQAYKGWEWVHAIIEMLNKLKAKEVVSKTVKFEKAS